MAQMTFSHPILGTREVEYPMTLAVKIARAEAGKAEDVGEYVELWSYCKNQKTAYSLPYTITELVNDHLGWARTFERYVTP